MIAFKGGRLSPRGHRTGLGGRFVPLMRYLVEGSRGDRNPDRVIHFATRHLPADTPLAAGFLMACCAEDRRPDFELPVYHFGASAAVGEELTPAQWEHVADLMLEELGLTEHEAAIVVHDDTKCQHVHIVVNRIGYDCKPFKPWMDYPKMRQAMRRAERQFGLKVVAEPLGHRDDRSAEPVAEPAEPEATAAEPGATAAEPVASGRPPRDETLLPVDRAWLTVDETLLPVDGRSARRSERPNQPRLNDVDFCMARQHGRQPLADAVRERALRDFLEADSWHDLEHRLARHGLRLEPARRGGGVVVWTDADEPVSVSKIDRRLSGPKLAKRFGEPFTTYRQRVPEPPKLDGFLPVRRVELGDRGDRVKAIIDAIQAERATFTEQEIRRHVRWQHDQDEIVEAVIADSRVQRIGLDDQERPIFTTTDYQRVERELLEVAVRLHERESIQLNADAVHRRLDRDFGFLSREQRAAVLASTSEGDLALIAGRAGSGKTALTKAIVDAYQDAGVRVQGAALTGKAAEGLGKETGIDSRTLAALRESWAKGRDQLDSRSVLLVDEAGMLGTRELAELLATVEQAGAKPILIGDPDQLRTIEAGDAFAGLLETLDGARIDTIRRQRVDWMRAASVDLADGRVAEALRAYDDHGAVGWGDDLGDAKWRLVSSYVDDLDEAPAATRLVLARRNADVDEINDLIRARLRQRGDLGRSIRLKGRELAEGDRVVFTRNDHDGRFVVNVPTDDADGDTDSVGVKNGTLGTLETATREAVRVRLDNGRLVAFDPRQYQDLRVGYAVTLYKAQGATVDRAFALLDPHLDRHGAYVAATRHRDHLSLWLDHQSFADLDAAARTLGRRGPNDLWIAAEGRAGDGDEDRAADALREAMEKHAAVPLTQLLRDPDNANERDLFENLPEIFLLRDGYVTTREYLDAEQNLALVADRLAYQTSSRIGLDEHLPPETDPDPVVRAVDGPDLTIFEGDRDAVLDHFKAVRDQYRGTDRELIAVAFTARHAEGLGRDLGVESHTFAGLKYRGHRLGKKTVLLVDQANLADVRTLGSVLSAAAEAGSRVLLCGDPDGFDPIGAGDAFRLVREDLGAVPLVPELESPALDAYARLHELDAAGRVHLADDPIQHITDAYLNAPLDERPCVLTHMRASADKLNQRIRHCRAHELGRTVEIDGRPFAEGDRVLFTASDAKGQAVRTVEGPEREHRPGVRSGLLGTLERVDDDLFVRLDDGRLVAFDPREFNAIDYGYALTTFRANGSQVDDVVVLAQSSMDRAAALIALSSHRRSLTVVGSSDAFGSVDDVAEKFGREREKPLARDLGDERMHAPRPVHRPGDGRPLQVVRGVEASEVAEPRGPGEILHVDPVRSTVSAIEKLRDYDAAVQKLDAIEAKRSRLLHGGDVSRLREALTTATGKEYTALLEELITVDQLDREAATVRLGLIGGRDHRVAAVFEASRHLGPDGFDQLAPADRALVRELWAITVEPMAEANRQLERARDKLAAEQPEVVHDDRFEQVFVALGTKAALATAPRPVQRAAATAFVVADLVRDTPRALLRMVTPKPLRHLLTAVRVAAHLLGDEPPRQLVPPSEPIQLPPRRKWRPFSVAELYDPKVVGEPKIFVLDEGKKARVIVDGTRRLGRSEPMSRRRAVAVREHLVSETRRRPDGKPDWKDVGIRFGFHPDLLQVVEVGGQYALRYEYENRPPVFEERYATLAEADGALDQMRRQFFEGERPDFRHWSCAEPIIAQLAEAIEAGADIEPYLDEAREATAWDLARSAQRLTPEERAALTEDLATYGEVKVRMDQVEALDDQIYDAEILHGGGRGSAVELRQQMDAHVQRLENLPKIEKLRSRILGRLSDRNFDVEQLVAKVPYSDFEEKARELLEEVRDLRRYGVVKVVALDRARRLTGHAISTEWLGDLKEHRYAILRLTPSRFRGAVRMLVQAADRSRQRARHRDLGGWEI